jgi:trimeric autotransporter adhesin
LIWTQLSNDDMAFILSLVPTYKNINLIVNEIKGKITERKKMNNNIFKSDIRKPLMESYHRKKWSVFRISKIAIFFILLLLNTNSVLSQTIDDNFYVTDSTVWCAVVLNNTLYLGGDFHKVAPFTGRGVTIDLSSGLYDNTMPKVNGEVHTVVPDGSGGWYIGGNFTKVGTSSRNNLAHIKSDKTVDDVWSASTNNTVYTLAVSGSTVYAGGLFSYANVTTARNRLAAFDATNGSVTSWNPNADGYVYALAISGNTVYAGGAFTKLKYGTITRNRLAAINSATGNIKDWNPDVDNTVFSLAISDSSIYAGGSFTSVNTSTLINRLASFDTVNGTARNWNPDVNDTVKTIAVNGNVYIGGAFTSVNGSTSRNRLAAIDASTGTATGWDPNANNTVNALVISGSNIYVGGVFTKINGSTERNRLAVLDITSGVASTWNPDANSSVYCLLLEGTSIYAGGIFNSVNGMITRNHLAAFDAVTGELKNWNPNVTGPSTATVHAVAFAANDETIFVGGIFDSVNGTTARNNLAAFDLNDGIVKNWNPNVDNEVRALLIAGEKIFAGGDFTTINNGSITRRGLAAFDTVNGTALNWNPGLNSIVRTLAFSHNMLYVGGDFTRANTTTVRNRIAAFDTSTGIATSWDPNINNYVRNIKIVGNTVFVGGEFTMVNGSVVRNNIASFCIANGTVSSWDPNPNSLVRALYIIDGTLYVGGNFTTISGATRNRVAAFDIANGTLTDWNPNAQKTVYSIFATNNKVYVGGSYTSILSGGHTYFAAMDDPYRVALPSAPGAPVATSATLVSETSFSANWNASASANGYYLDVATDSLFTSFVTGYNNLDVCNVTTYVVNSGIVTNTTYYYRVRAYNIGGTSANSNKINLTTGSVVANLKVFLQGCYNSGAMTTSLNTGGYIPLTQPYNTAPWIYSGTETVASIPATVVDWILIELRAGTDAATKVAERAGFLKSDGSVVDTNGTNLLTFRSVNAGNYYVVVRHRNHLAIMSANAVALNTTSTLYDFTTAQTQAYGADAMKDLGSGIYGLYSGDGNSDGQITTLDYDIFLPLVKSATTGYNITDWNMDGLITTLDFDIWLANAKLAKTTKVSD